MHVPEKPPLIVCVDDEAEMLASVRRCLRQAFTDVRTTLSAAEAMQWIAAEDVAVLVSDYDMPEMTGAQLAGHARRIRPECVRILLTGQRSLETAVDGIHQGEIFRFLNKPFDNETLREAVRAAVARNLELVAMLGDRRHRERREALYRSLEAEYPGISEVSHGAGIYEIAVDPWDEAAELGIAGLTSKLEQGA